MGYEIERKFLVKGDFKSHAYKSLRLKQGYLSLSGMNVVRVRITDETAFLTVKSALTEGAIKRSEWEYEIPATDAVEMLEMCGNRVIDKTRYFIREGDHLFEVDEFYGDNEGLLIAEVELKSEDEPFERPHWLGAEVTGNVRYYNSYLFIHPYEEWKDDEEHS